MSVAINANEANATHGPLSRALADASRWAYGTVFAEVYVLNPDRTLLFRPEEGFHMDPVFHCEEQCGQEDCELCWLCSNNSENNVIDVTPGQNLAETLLKKENEFAQGVRSSFVQGARSSFVLRRSQPESRSSTNTRRRSTLRMSTALRMSVTGSSGFIGGKSKNAVTWRAISELVSDPDQPWNPRLKLLGSLGLGYVTVVDFTASTGQTGIVVFMAREGVDLDRLQSETNGEYLTAASYMIGAAYGLQDPLRQVVEERNAERAAILHRVKGKMIDAIRMGVSLESLAEDNTPHEKPEEKELHDAENDYFVFVENIQQRAVTTLRKAKGGGGQSPPPMGWYQSLLTTFGCFVTLLMISRLGVHVTDTYGEDYSIVLGPFGALMTLLYGLTAAPASQPRNAILGQAVSLTIAICVGSSDGTLTIWMRQSLATALAVGTMAKLGITHPPAGAAALIYASGEYGWGNALFMLVANVIAIAVAMLVNNGSDKRQYPTYWGMAFPFALVEAMGSQKADGKQKSTSTRTTMALLTNEEQQEKDSKEETSSYGSCPGNESWV